MVRRIATAIFCSMAITAHADTALFDFDGPDSPINTPTPFALTRSGLTARFTSEFQFYRVETALSEDIATMTGNVLTLGRPGPIVTPLRIGLSASQTSVDLLFWLGDASGGSMLTMTLFDGNSSISVGSASASGTIPPGFQFPEGELSFSGATFDRIVLSSTSAMHPSFAIDDLRLEPGVPIPEPEIAWLLAPGLLAVAGITRRRQRLRA